MKRRPKIIFQLKPVVHWQKLMATDYFQVIRRWKQWRTQVLERLLDLDVLIVPTTMIPAAPLRLIDQDLDSYQRYNFKYMRNTSVGNILNLCGVSLPCGFSRDGLPVGVLVYAKPFQEDTALRVAYAYERATQWHQRRPKLPLD